MKKRKLFCELSPTTYKISQFKQRTIRNTYDFFSSDKFSRTKSSDLLPVSIYKHTSLMRRKLGNTDLQLQENKVINLSLATPKVSGILIKPGETFSFWHLVGACSAKHGYREGLTISFDKATKGVGGGMCQFTNLIHWMILHTPLIITEHHHHEGIDLFPDFGRQVPFGTGTSVMYNYLDYRFKNITEQPYQLVVYTDKQYLHGEIRTTKPLSIKYHIKTEGEGFVKEGEDIFRIGKIFRYCIDKRTGTILKKELIKENHAKVMYPISL